MAGDGSLLNWIAIAVYVVVALVAAWVGIHERKSLWLWIGIALFFVVLAALRWFEIEDIVRADMREWLRERGGYGGRRQLQRELTALLVALVATFGIAGVFFARRGFFRRIDKLSVAALAACLGMLGLIGLRLVSLHTTDALLYGPIKLNWIADLGLSLAVLAAAALRIRLIR